MFHDSGYHGHCYNVDIKTLFEKIMIVRLLILDTGSLEHNQFKNVSKGPAFFCDKQKFKRLNGIEYDLNDTIRIKKNEVVLILYSFTLSDIKFQTLLMDKMNLANILPQKQLVPRNHSNLKHAIERISLKLRDSLLSYSNNVFAYIPILFRSEASLRLFSLDVIRNIPLPFL